MLLVHYFGFYDYWELRHKVTFDPISKLIYINPGESNIDVKTDLYSAAKQWLLQENNLRWKPPMRTTGGDIIPGGGVLGSTYFMTNGWRIYINSNVEFDGNLYSDDYSSPFLQQEGTSIVRSKFTSLVDTANVPSAIQNAAAVWNAALAAYVAAGSAGKIVKDIERKTDDTQAIVLTK